jgi:hypothetical protein
MSRFEDTMHTARDAMGTATAATGQRMTSARESLMDGVRGLATVVSVARGLRLGKVLGLVGLTRRRGPLGAIALFGTGFVAGAGVTALFTPMSGSDLRRRFVDRFHGLFDKGENVVRKVGEEVQSEVQAGEKKVDELADKAHGTISTAERAAHDLARKVQESLIAADQGRTQEGEEQQGQQARQGQEQETSGQEQQGQGQQGQERHGRSGHHTGKHHGHHAARS